MWHNPKAGHLETQVQKKLKKKSMPRAMAKTKAQLGVKTVESRTARKKKTPEPSFHQFPKLPLELQISIWRHAADLWLASMLKSEASVYTRKSSMRRTAPHDIGLLPHYKSALFAVCSVSRSMVFETLRTYDKDIEEWEHADAKWFEKGKWKQRKVWMVDARDFRGRKSGLEIIDFDPLRRSGRNMKRIDYTGMDHDIEDKKKKSKKK